MSWHWGRALLDAACHALRMADLPGVLVEVRATRADLERMSESLARHGVVLRTSYEARIFALWLAHMQARGLSMHWRDEDEPWTLFEQALERERVRESENESATHFQLAAGPGPDEIITFTMVAMASGVLGNAASELVKSAVHTVANSVRWRSILRRRKPALKIAPATQEPDVTRTTRTILVGPQPVTLWYNDDMPRARVAELCARLFQHIEREGWRLGLTVAPPRQMSPPSLGRLFTVQGTVSGWDLTDREAEDQVTNLIIRLLKEFLGEHLRDHLVPYEDFVAQHGDHVGRNAPWYLPRPGLWSGR